MRISAKTVLRDLKTLIDAKGASRISLERRITVDFVLHVGARIAQSVSSQQKHRKRTVSTV